MTFTHLHTLGFIPTSQLLFEYDGAGRLNGNVQPPSTFGRVHAKSDGKLYFHNGAGIEYDLTDGGTDNLGNHIATQTLNMSANAITNVPDLQLINRNDNPGNNGTVFQKNGNLYFKTSSGTVHQVTPSDNLGNHTATQELNMAGHDIYGVDAILHSNNISNPQLHINPSIGFSTGTTGISMNTGSTNRLVVAGGNGATPLMIMASTGNVLYHNLNMSGNRISSVGEMQVVNSTSNPSINGAIFQKNDNLYFKTSSGTVHQVTPSDNLGNHTATQDLTMGTHSIEGSTFNITSSWIPVSGPSPDISWLAIDAIPAGDGVVGIGYLRSQGTTLVTWAGSTVELTYDGAPRLTTTGNGTFFEETAIEGVSDIQLINNSSVPGNPSVLYQQSSQLYFKSNDGTIHQITPPASGGGTNFNVRANSGTSTNITDGETISYVAGTGMTITRSGNSFTFNSTGGGGTNFSVRANSDTSTTINDGELISYVAGTGMTITRSGNSFTFNSTGGGGGTNFNVRANSGTSTNITDGETISYVAGTGMTITRSGNSFTFNSTGGSADNLGNHTATQALNMSSNGITNATYITEALPLDSVNNYIKLDEASLIIHASQVSSFRVASLTQMTIDDTRTKVTLAGNFMSLGQLTSSGATTGDMWRSVSNNNLFYRDGGGNVQLS